MSNHLAGESSPYLLQHKDNPVDWHPWGRDALRLAHDRDKPIFLSIGYSACHWCHVMERESFTDTETAALLNNNFVSVKVDREERPDLDDVYMQAVTALTGSGGWPLSVWLTPEGVPFYGGTYFPPVPHYGRPSFKQVLTSIADLWQNRREKLQDAAAGIHAHLCRDAAGQQARASRVGQASAAAAALAESVDRDHGGWGGAPKFPQTPVLEFLLANQALQPQPQVEVALRLTLDAMAAGGMYDQLAGGFHRYSTDALWLVPHFEKMLYDNAQLARCYLHAWQLLGDRSYRRITEETLAYLLGSMRHPQGGFFSAEDADSEGMEGAFYTWTLSQVEAVLSPPDVAFATQAYGLTQRGNLDGANVLRAASSTPEDQDRLKEVRTKLLRARDERARPARDEKILAGWNGLALSALADTAAALSCDRYAGAATETGRFIVNAFVGANGRLAHSWKDGRVSGQAFLGDYAAVAEGLLALYAATFDEHWFVTARALIDTVLEHFRRPEGGFFDTSDEHERLIVRPRSLHDGPTASGNSLTATVLTRMAAYTGEARYGDAAEETLDSAPAILGRAPVMHGQWLSAGLLAEKGSAEVAMVGELSHPAGEALFVPLRSLYRPDLVLAARPAGRPTQISILQDREPPPGAAIAAWVCRNSACSPPTDDPRELRRLIEPVG